MKVDLGATGSEYFLQARINLGGTRDRDRACRRRNVPVFESVGYTGGDVPNATYRNHGTHAEAIEIVFDPSAAEPV